MSILNIRPEGHRKLENISQFVFHAFDKGKVKAFVKDFIKY